MLVGPVSRHNECVVFTRCIFARTSCFGCRAVAGIGLPEMEQRGTWIVNRPALQGVQRFSSVFSKHGISEFSSITMSSSFQIAIASKSLKNQF